MVGDLKRKTLVNLNDRTDKADESIVSESIHWQRELSQSSFVVLDIRLSGTSKIRRRMK